MLDFSFSDLYTFILTAMVIIVAYRNKNEFLNFIVTVINIVLTHINRKGDKK